MRCINVEQRRLAAAVCNLSAQRFRLHPSRILCALAKSRTLTYLLLFANSCLYQLRADYIDTCMRGYMEGYRVGTKQLHMQTRLNRA